VCTLEDHLSVLPHSSRNRHSPVTPRSRVWRSYDSCIVLSWLSRLTLKGRNPPPFCPASPRRSLNPFPTKHPLIAYPLLSLLKMAEDSSPPFLIFPPRHEDFFSKSAGVLFLRPSRLITPMSRPLFPSDSTPAAGPFLSLFGFPPLQPEDQGSRRCGPLPPPVGPFPNISFLPLCCCVSPFLPTATHCPL